MRCSSTEKGSAGRLRRCAPAETGMKAGALGHVYVNFPIKKQASLLLRFNQSFVAALWYCSTPVGGVLPWLLFANLAGLGLGTSAGVINVLFGHSAFR